jgi:hypothetical protein
VTANVASTGGGLLPRLSREQLDGRLADFANTTPEAMRAARRNLMADPTFAAKMDKLSKQIASVRADARVAPSAGTMYEARRQRAVGTELEAELNTTAMRQIAGMSSIPVSDAAPCGVSSPAPQARTTRTVQRSLRAPATRSPSPITAPASMHEAPVPRFVHRAWVTSSRRSSASFDAARASNHVQAARGERDAEVHRAARALLRHHPRDGALGRPCATTS